MAPLVSGKRPAAPTSEEPSIDVAALTKCGPFIVLQGLERWQCHLMGGVGCRAMERPIERLQDILASVRVGRASPGMHDGRGWPYSLGTAVKKQHSVIASTTAGMLDHLKVDAYGDKLSLRSMASVSVRESQLLAVSPFDAQVRCCVLDIKQAMPSMAICTALQAPCDRRD